MQLKYFISVSFLLLCSVLLMQCATQKRTEYWVPEEYTGETRANFVKRLETGQKLFKLKCSPCHGIFTEGKDSIPNFSKTQIEAYRSSILLEDPKNHAFAQKIRPVDLDMILLFLELRKSTKPQ